MELKNYKKLIWVTVIFIFGVWIGGWVTSDVKGMTNLPFGDVFNSVNALFAGLAFGGVIITIAMQLQELKESREELKRTADANNKSAEANEIMAKAMIETAEANKKTVEANEITAQAMIDSANEAKEKAILELYQTYCSTYFQEVKDSSFRVMTSAIKNKDYADFMISRFFVVVPEHIPEKITQEITDQLPRYSNGKSLEEFIEKEKYDRFKFDELINFFILLSNKQSSKDVIKKCDFFYDWYRPLFWFISELQLEHYNKYSIVQDYSKKPYFRGVVEKLDEIYEYEAFKEDESKKIWKYILGHPKIQAFGIDKKYLKKLEEN